MLAPTETPFRIAFFGLPLGALCLLHDGVDVPLAVLSPVEAPGHRRLLQKLGDRRVLEAARLGEDLNATVGAALLATRPDLLVSWFWTRKVRADWLPLARLGGVNVHPSLLPRHRGPDPYFWAIDSGDDQSGATVHRLAPEYDSGDLLLQETLPVGNRNAWQLARALDRPALRLLREAVRRYARGEALVATPQNAALATPAPAPSGDLLRVDWHWPTGRILRRIRALAPAPGLALEVAGARFFATHARAAPHPAPHLEPGEAAVDERVAIATGDGAIIIERALIGADTDFEEGAEVAGPILAQWVGERLARGQNRGS
jgi:methionyl-tRNA formyltransferase